MDRSAPKHTPNPSSPADRGASEIRDGLVLAFLARKRLLVLVGEAGSGRTAVYRQLVEHVDSDGAMALPVTATVGADVEELILAAGEGALPDTGDGGEPDFDTLIGALEERLDLAGSGLLAVEDASLLAPPVLADLVELTRSETAAGRFLQVLLCGTPDLERALTRAGLADSLRELGVIYRMAPGAAPSVTPMAVSAADGAAPKPAAAKAAAKPKAVTSAPILAAPEPAPPEPPRRARPSHQPAPHQSAGHQPANDWNGGFDWSGRGAEGEAATGATVMPGPPDNPDILHPEAHRPPRRAALYAGAALTTLVLLAAAGAAVLTSVPGILPDSARAGLERGWSDARSFVERNLQGLPGQGPTGHRATGQGATGGSQEGDALALGAPRTAQAETPAARPPSPGTPQPPGMPATAPPTTPTALSIADHTPPAAQPPVSSIQTAALPPPANTPAAPPFMPASPPAVLAPPPATSEAPPGTAALPPLEEPSHAASAPAVQPPFESEAVLTQRTRALVDQARRQLAGKRLTTPPGDNAYETVQRLRLVAPHAPEAAELVATMEDTYRRWAMAAEREGDWNEARRFYERALMVSPENPDLRERVKAAGERRSLGPAAPAPATVTPGLNSRESVLALLRNPTELSRSLQSGTAPDTRLDNGKTLLMIAAEQGLTDAVRILLERHANTGLRTSDGATAVMYAAWGGYESVVGALADGGAELDATNDDGKTALMAAAARGHVGVAQVLLQRGVAVDRTTANGWSALMYAANNGHDRVAKLLLDRGANPYRMDTNGNSALTLGALQGHVQVVEALKPR
ncbi:ankyrin repeat domain-containing protein [Azospirillum agricola]|uniref:ankyrin repeat domain-containing protein n=1 Tax=Azospirillum agricola TaxID=1720247 RepID=UPI000A0F0863|nr:ankyrin repeat domain-containing protein [Azospirillum agricola]SMH54076.1 Ankyrin repeat [Azospirillum lipoferum]